MDAAPVAMERIWQDLRYACRTLSHSPGFLAVSVVTLALGIGANTAIFNLINAVMLRALPVPHAEQLVLLTDPASSFIAADTLETGERSLLAYPEFTELRARAGGMFSGLFAAQSTLSDLDMQTSRGGPGQSTKTHTQLVSGEFFGVLGIQPAIGRFFTPAEDKVPGANPVAVLSYGFWQREFGGDPRVLSETIRLGQSTFHVVGVGPRGFHGILAGSEADVWLPITMQAQVLPGRDYLNPHDVLWLQSMGRLAPGISRPAAEAGINVVLRQVAREWLAPMMNQTERRRLEDQKIVLKDGARGASALRAQFSDPLVMLMAMVGLVLLIACANIANLTLARGAARQREIGIRLALGAARRRIVRQLLTESLLVALAGGVLGTILAAWGTDLLLALVSAGIDHVAIEFTRDYRVFLFTAAVSLSTAILFGLVPAFGATRVDINRALGGSARGGSGSRGHIRSGRVLVVVQVTLSLLLLMGATLFLRSLHNLFTQKLGFERDHLLMVSLDPLSAGYKPASRSGLYQRVREKLRAVPGVRSVSLSNTAMFGGDSGDHISIDSPPAHPPGAMTSAWTLAGPDYFKTAGIPLLRGREMDASDAARGAQVCLINESFVRYFFPNGDPIGKHVTDEYPTTRETYEIIGVVADARERRLRGRQESRFYANLFHPIGELRSVVFLLRTSPEAAGIGDAVRHAVGEIDRSIPILSIRTVNEQIDRRLIIPRLIAELSTFFGGLALLLAAIGLYGVMSYAMSRRTSEIGLRVALGASHGAVVWMVLRELLWLVGIGVAIGLPCSYALGRLVSSSLFGITPADPVSISIAVTVIVAVTLVAGFLPARRASRIDPMRALRWE